MKPFQTILFLAVMILIGGMAALFWGKSVEEAVEDLKVADVVEVVEVVEEPEELASGDYLVFQADEWFFYRLAVADVGTRQPQRFATLKNPLSVSGGLVPYVYGRDLILHRYQDEDQDGIVSLEGEVVETRPQQWATLRSANGRYEVVWDSPYDEVDTQTVVTNRTTGEVVWPLPTDTIETPFVAEPFLIDDDGIYLYIHETCACEATVAGVWQVEIATGEATRLDTLVDLDSWFLSSLDADGRRLLAVSTRREPAEDGPYEDLLPPTTIRLLDLDTLEVEELLVDEERAWDRPLLDPEGNDRYVVRLWDEGNKQYLVNFDDKEIGEEHFLTDGWVLEWVGEWLVVRDPQDSTLTLVNVETKEEVRLEIPGERVEYVGSVEIE